MGLIELLNRVFCLHVECIIKTDGTRMYTECLKCGHQSAGVVCGH